MKKDDGNEHLGFASPPTVTRHGTSLEQEKLISMVTSRFPAKPYCIVSNWRLFKADLMPEELVSVENAGYLPLFVFAFDVILDSQGRFQPGNWVRSSMCVKFLEGFLFETRNTVYVLVGDGEELKASLKTIFSFN